MSVILRLLWLWRNDLKVDFTNLTVQWRSDAEDSLITLLLKETTIEGLMRKLRDLEVNYIVQRLQIIDSDELKSSATLISEVYKSLTEVFSETQTETLPLHHKSNYSIDLLKKTTSPFELMYNLSAKDLTVLQKYLNNNLTNSFIQSL